MPSPPLSLPTCTFLTSAQSAQWIRTHHTTYLNHTLQCPYNARARTYTSRDTFCQHLREWTPEETRELTRVVQQCVDRCWSWRSMLLHDRWTFLHVDDTLESGMPHTIHTAIVLPQRLVRNLLPETAESPQAHRTAIETLLHERIHVLQKKYPKRFDRLYQGWGYRPVDTPSDPHYKTLQQLHQQRVYRTNPDTPRRWVWRDEWYPFAELMRPGSPSERPALHRCAYHLVRLPPSTPSSTSPSASPSASPSVSPSTSPTTLWDTITSTLSPSSMRSFSPQWYPMHHVRAYTEYHGHCEHGYHPDETAAVLLSEEMMRDWETAGHEGSREAPQSEAHGVMRGWCVNGWG